MSDSRWIAADVIRQLKQAEDYNEVLVGLVNELKREVMSKKWRIKALESEVKEKEGWRDIENVENQRLEAERESYMNSYRAMELERDRYREALECIADPNYHGFNEEHASGTEWARVYEDAAKRALEGGGE